MPVSPEIVEEHVQAWETKLSFGHRRHWPSRLFRHEVLENALEVLRSGQLLSRRDAGALRRDVAPEVIINANQLAHGFARLYFRPRTPTQYRIEGIRKPDEIWNGRHAPVIYMFVFRSRSLLSRQGVHFSRGNMQVADAEVLDGDEAFRSLAFEKIYHEGAYSSENADIKVWRCAEVLVESPMTLDEALEAVVCRSDAERKTLLFHLGDQAQMWADRIRVMSQPGYFNAEYAFVESVDLQSDGMYVQFHPRRHLPMECNVQARVSSVTDLARNKSWPLQPLDLRKRWRFQFEVVADTYEIEILIENEMAYKSRVVFDLEPF